MFLPRLVITGAMTCATELVIGWRHKINKCTDIPMRADNTPLMSRAHPAYKRCLRRVPLRRNQRRETGSNGKQRCPTERSAYLSTNLVDRTTAITDMKPPSLATFFAHEEVRRCHLGSAPIGVLGIAKDALE